MTTIGSPLGARSPITDSPESVIGLYFRQVGERHCPYLLPALRAGAVYVAEYDVRSLGVDAHRLAAFATYQALRHVEWWRDLRRLAPAQRRLLLCDNVVLIGADDVRWPSVLEWPHFILKALYSDVGAMFGKFWMGEQSISRRGDPVIVPPLTFLSIRSAVPTRDPRLIAKTPQFVAAIRDGSEDGRNVLASLVPDSCADFETFERLGYFEKLRDWASRLLARPLC